MLQLTEKRIYSSFLNASRKEISDMTLPPDLSVQDWDSFDFFGWRDPKLPLRAYAAIPLGADQVGVILLTRTRGSSSLPAQCSWCNDVSLPNPVVLYGAKRPKRPGSRYSSVATLICENFQCSHNARKVLPMDYEGFDPEVNRLNQIAKLQEKVSAFAGLFTR